MLNHFVLAVLHEHCENWMNCRALLLVFSNSSIADRKL